MNSAGAQVRITVLQPYSVCGNGLFTVQPIIVPRLISGVPSEAQVVSYHVGPYYLCMSQEGQVPYIS